MGVNEAIQKLQQFILDHGLPRTDMALFGITCPYCGKSDRIRRLEDPEALQGDIDPEGLRNYTELWVDLTEPSGSLGVCKFCHNPLKIFVERSKAEALYT